MWAVLGMPPKRTHGVDMGGQKAFTAETADRHNPLTARVSATDVSRANGTDSLRWTITAAHLCSLLPKPATESLMSTHRTHASRGMLNRHLTSPPRNHRGSKAAESETWPSPGERECTGRPNAVQCGEIRRQKEGIREEPRRCK